MSILIRKNILLFTLLFLIGWNCGRKSKENITDSPSPDVNFILADFNALTNYNESSNDSVRTIELDYTDALNTGFVIPSLRQVEEGMFICKFKIKNISPQPVKFGYKIYYQNESYKFPETDSTGKNKNEFAAENFYGSWEDTTVLFRTTELIPPDGEFHEIVDSIRIVGNPRSEELFYSNGKNDRWKRNPRVGIYSFLLTVTESRNLTDNIIPLHVQNIGLLNGDRYLSPYYYFLFGDGKKLSNVASVFSSTGLKVIARPDPGSGIYYSQNNFSAPHEKRIVSNCGNDSALFNKAAFEQFIHYIDASACLENIPVVSDVLKDNYSKREYNWNRSFYRREELISGTPKVAQKPCETVYSDPANKKIIIRNPKTAPGKWRKENVGVITRHGLCYGKIRVKAKLTELLNKNNVWNGITNAIWLIYQSDSGAWNKRRACNKEGYMSTYWGGKDDKRVSSVSYSEIDFEILKTPNYCPEATFPPVYKNPTGNPRDINSWDSPLPEEVLKDDGNISVACTNWDMACWEPENFGVGCNSITYKNQKFDLHRWDHWYRAITTKYSVPDDILFGSPYYYFEIEWRPSEIIWRIGPEANKMYTVGYMNDKVTSVPNNQMLLIVTQEFHNTNWWPGSPYQQDFIPFPANDLVGEILEITIE